MNSNGSSRPKVGIVLVAYNNPDYINRCLESIQVGTYDNVEIIVVDNSTIAGSQHHQPRSKNIHYHKTDDNVGFCAASNIGIAISLELKTDYTLMLNFDTVLVEDAIEKLVKTASALKNPGIIGGKIFYLSEPDRIWYAGGYLSRLSGVGKHRGFNEKDTGKYDVSGEVTYATGCCMLVPSEVFSKLGGFKEDLFMYLDDAEFSLRILNAKLSIYYEPSAIIYHEVGPGSEKKAYSDYYLYFSIRNKPFITGNPFYRAYLRIFTLALALSKLGFYGLTPGISGRPVKLKSILWGYIDSFSLKPNYRKRFPRLFEKGGADADE